MAEIKVPAENQVEYLHFKSMGGERQVPTGMTLFSFCLILKSLLNREGLGSGKTIGGLWIIFGAIPLAL